MDEEPKAACKFTLDSRSLVEFIGSARGYSPLTLVPTGAVGARTDAFTCGCENTRSTGLFPHLGRPISTYLKYVKLSKSQLILLLWSVCIRFHACMTPQNSCGVTVLPESVNHCGAVSQCCVSCDGIRPWMATKDFTHEAQFSSGLLLS